MVKCPVFQQYNQRHIHESTKRKENNCIQQHKNMCHFWHFSKALSPPKDKCPYLGWTAISHLLILKYQILYKLYITFFLSFHILSNVRKALFYRLYGHFHFLFTFAYRGISSYVFPLKRGKFRGKYFYAIRRFISVLALSIEECAYQSIVILILE